MPSTLDRLKNDIDILTRRGQDLFLAMNFECFSTTIVQQLTKEYGKSKAEEIVQNLPAFAEAYEAWYSEAKALVKHLLPDRLQDFISHYEAPKSRRDLTADNYRITDYLQAISVTNKMTREKIVGQEAATLIDDALYAIEQRVGSTIRMDQDENEAIESARNGLAVMRGEWFGGLAESMKD